MPRNGSGTYSLAQPAFVAGTVISSAAMNSDLNDIALALTGSLPRDGQAGMLGQLKLTDGSTIAPAVSFNNETNTGFIRVGPGEIGVVIQGNLVTNFSSIGAAGTVPIGTIVDYGGTTAPQQWLLCYGQAISRSTYALLFTAIGTNFGVGDGSTTFNIPDLRGSTTVFSDSAFGNTGAAGRINAFFGGSPFNIGGCGGNQSAALIPANMATHTHGINANTGVDVPDHSHGIPNVFLQSTGVSAGPTGPGFSGTIGAAQNTSGASVRHAHNLTATTDSGGLSNPGSAFGIIQPSLVVAKMIFAGV